MILTIVPPKPLLNMTMKSPAPLTGGARGKIARSLVQHLPALLVSVAEMDKEEIWSIVRKVKTDRLWKEKADCVLDDFSWPPLGKGYLKHGSRETLLDDIDEGGVIDSEARLQPDDLTDELWTSGFAMFLHLAYCPDTETETWAKFYE